MNFFRLLLVAPLIFVLFACGDSSPESKGTDMLIKEWQTYAMGRMLVDLPLGAVIDEKEEMVDGTTLTWRKDLTPENALIEVARREQEHKDFPPAPDRPPSKYIATIDLANGARVSCDH